MKGRFGALFHLVPFRPHEAVRAISARLARAGSAVAIEYRLEGDIARLRIPDKMTGGELWQHTCFEIFAAPPGMPSYLEFNFSPSGDWASYSFSSYRRGTRFASADPRIKARITPDAMELAATIDLPGAHSVGLSAVIEDADGALHYWALKHPGAKPDFHHRDAFAARLE